ncbi:hypothetical protein G7Z17_g8445 [Cylindrodendrum hubeiense]|uniref:Uncharacterized protein n=1 Tax=Cylindrodendrum hubeiense TaxID=595255 RepID=A0A9P5H175_9HYPO|nr:hypothetical protein G7Z17_g8445 [Cylindrodendrum hubeiense]
MAESKPQRRSHLIERGVKKPNIAGTLTFLGLRSLDPILQYNLLAGGGAALLTKLGITAATATVGTSLHTGFKAIDSLGLPLPRLIILGMAAGSSLKQSYWLVALSQEHFPPITAVAVSVYKTFVNTLNTLLFLAGSPWH